MPHEARSIPWALFDFGNRDALCSLALVLTMICPWLAPSLSVQACYVANGLAFFYEEADAWWRRLGQRPGYFVSICAPKKRWCCRLPCQQQSRPARHCCLDRGPLRRVLPQLSLCPRISGKLAATLLDIFAVSSLGTRKAEVVVCYHFLLSGQVARLLD